MKEKRSRELDNSAKLFPLVICKKYNGTFRISFTLSSNINEYQLQKATMKTLDEIPFFKFKLKRGLFWHYLVLNNSPVVINKSSKKICNKINFKDNNNYLFNITYSNNKVNVDILHYLCDGISGKIFVNKILENYLIINNNHPNVFNSKINYTINDDYIKNYNQKIKSVKEKENTTNIYKVKGTLLQDNNIDITKLNINLKSLKRKSQKKQCSVTEYICGILIYSIKNTSTYKNTINKRIRVCVPIDLRTPKI